MHFDWWDALVDKKVRSFSDRELDQIRRSLSHRNQFIRYTMADIIARGEWDDFGLFRILNRLSFISTRQLAFVIYKLDQSKKSSFKGLNKKKIGSSRIVVQEVSMFDPALQDKLYRDLQKGPHALLGSFDPTKKTKDQELHLNPTTIKPYEIRLFASDYYILILKLNIKEARCGIEPEIKFEPVSRTDPMGQFFTDVLHEFDGKIPRIKFEPEDVKLQLSNLYSHGYIPAKDIPPEKQSFDRQDAISTSMAIDYVQRVINKEYKKISLAPVLATYLSEKKDWDRYNKLINVFYFAKAFRRNTTRYAHYYFDTFLLLPEEQKSRLRAALKEVSDQRSDFIPYDDAGASEAFWSDLQSEDGINEILRLLQHELSADSRLFPENALMSGALMIKPGVFSRSAIGWIKPGSNLTSDERRIEMKAFAAFHYVLQLGSPITPADSGKRLSLVSYPFRCAGGIWMTGTHVRLDEEMELGGRPLSLLNHEAFEHNFLMYHSIFRESERRIRRWAKYRWLVQVSFLVKEAVRKTPKRDNSVPLDERNRLELNMHLRNLCRVFPLPLLWLDDSLEPRIVSNPFFDRLNDEKSKGDEHSGGFVRRREIRQHVYAGLRAGMSI